MSWQPFRQTDLEAQVLVMDGWMSIVWRSLEGGAYRWMTHRSVPTEGPMAEGKASDIHAAQTAAMEAVPALRAEMHAHAAEGLTW